MPVTLEEIAKATGFSVPTVSRALTNPDYPLSAATRQRINDVDQQMGYIPNLTARRILGDSCRTTMCIAPRSATVGKPAALSSTCGDGSHSRMSFYIQSPPLQMPD
jgi:DNA-binding LacI/PurR family transcriptional regulator